MFTIYFMYIISCCTGHHVKKGKHQSNNHNFFFPEKRMKIPLQLKMEQARTAFFFFFAILTLQMDCPEILYSPAAQATGDAAGSRHE